MSGGKGGSQSSSVSIPGYLEDAAKQNIARAEQVQQLGYQPYYGLDVAGFNPTQQAAAQMNIDTAQAFGMMPGSATSDRFSRHASSRKCRRYDWLFISTNV